MEVVVAIPRGVQLEDRFRMLDRRDDSAPQVVHLQQKDVGEEEDLVAVSALPPQTLTIAQCTLSSAASRPA